MPPRVGPIDGPTIAPSEVSAWLKPSCFAGNVSRMIAWPVEIRPPPHRPCNTRKKISSSSEVEIPHSIEVMVNPMIAAT